MIPKYTEINTYAINLKKGRQSPYRSIYSLKLLELETVKIYIKINLANSFIRFSKSPASALILFDKKLNKSLRFYVNY